MKKNWASHRHELWTWETAYRRWFILRFTLLLIALALSIILAYIFFVDLPAYERVVAAGNDYRPDLHAFSGHHSNNVQ